MPVNVRVKVRDGVGVGDWLVLDVRLRDRVRVRRGVPVADAEALGGLAVRLQVAEGVPLTVGLGLRVPLPLKVPVPVRAGDRVELGEAEALHEAVVVCVGVGVGACVRDRDRERVERVADAEEDEVRGGEGVAEGEAETAQDGVPVRVALGERDRECDSDALAVALMVVLALTDVRVGVPEGLRLGDAVGRAEQVGVGLGDLGGVVLRLRLGLKVTVAEERVWLALRDRDSEGDAVRVERVGDAVVVPVMDPVSEHVQVRVAVGWGLGLGVRDTVVDAVALRVGELTVALEVRVLTVAERVRVGVGPDGERVGVAVRGALCDREAVGGLGVGVFVAVERVKDSSEAEALREGERLNVAVRVGEGVGL